MQDSDFDLDTYRERMEETVLNAYRSHAHPEKHPSDALSEAVYDGADEWLRTATTADAIALLEASSNEATEWQPFARDESDWEEVVKAMAFTVARQDAYDVLEERGYLDEYRNATEKLEEVGTAEA